MKIITEQHDGVTIDYITDDVYHYSFGYYSANKWIDDHRVVLVRSTEPELKAFSRHAELVLVDVEKQTETLLTDLPPSPDRAYGSGYIEGYVVNGWNLYYMQKYDSGDELWHMDMQTGEKHRMFAHPNDLYFPHTTNDGRFLNFEMNPAAPREPFRCIRVNTQTDESDVVFEKRFQNPLPEVTHIMISPTDPDTVFFCHEGNTFYISNRLWLYTKEKGMFPLAKQRLDEEGNLGDCFGHECWTPDGQGLWFVKYPCSPLPPRGLCYVSIHGEQTDVQYQAYPYWHVCCAPNNRFLAADTQSSGYSGVCFIDTATGQETMVRKAGTTWQHPTHPHPSFNLDSSLLIFHEWKDEHVALGLVRTADLVK